jgi:hypothetical protein
VNKDEIEAKIAETEVPPSIAKLILEQDIQTIKNSIYQLQIRYRVNRKIGSSEADLSNIVADLEKMEKLLDAYIEESKAIVT